MQFVLGALVTEKQPSCISSSASRRMLARGLLACVPLLAFVAQPGQSFCF